MPSESWRNRYARERAVFAVGLVAVPFLPFPSH